MPRAHRRWRITVATGKIVLAEFTYGGKVTPSFPLDPRVPRRSMWYLKTKLLPWLLESRVQWRRFDIPHKERNFAKAAYTERLRTVLTPPLKQPLEA